MKGTVAYHKERRIYYVTWYYNGKTRKIYKYKGELMYHRKVAEKLLAVMQSDWENGVFRWDKYTKMAPTDIITYLWEWLEAIEPSLSPATYKDYKNSIKNHLVPFFQEHHVQLHEIQLDTLTLLLNSINRSGKGKMNVMYCLHACLDFAYRARRIESVPPFPKKREYGIVEPAIKWLPENRQDAVIRAIPEQHQPIFWWLKYHVRRPSEACALFKDDFDGEVFHIRRSFSARRLHERTKTGKVHIIPCHSDFRPIWEAMPKTLGPFFFTNPSGRLPGKYYNLYVLEDLWNNACTKAGENIALYPGLKHSRCSQMINEWGYSLDEVQMVTDHARRDSVKRYGKTEVARRKALMEGKVIRIDRSAQKVPRGGAN